MTKTTTRNAKSSQDGESKARANRPVHEIRLGRIKATIWENATETGTRHNVTLARLYKDADDQWRDSHSFGRDDLPLAAKVADLAHTWIYGEGRSSPPTDETPF
jgi:hypothetical protein